MDKFVLEMSGRNKSKTPGKTYPAIPGYDNWQSVPENGNHTTVQLDSGYYEGEDT